MARCYMSYAWRLRHRFIPSKKRGGTPSCSLDFLGCKFKNLMPKGLLDPYEMEHTCTDHFIGKIPKLFVDVLRNLWAEAMPTMPEASLRRILHRLLVLDAPRVSWRMDPLFKSKYFETYRPTSNNDRNIILRPSKTKQSQVLTSVVILLAFTEGFTWEEAGCS